MLVLVLIRGSKKLSTKRFHNLTGIQLQKASPEEIFAKTGFAIGSIPSFGFVPAILTFIDERLVCEAELWCGTGDSNTACMIPGDKLVELSAGHLLKV